MPIAALDDAIQTRYGDRIGSELHEPAVLLFAVQQGSLSQRALGDVDEERGQEAFSDTEGVHIQGSPDRVPVASDVSRVPRLAAAAHLAQAGGKLGPRDARECLLNAFVDPLGVVNAEDLRGRRIAPPEDQLLAVGQFEEMHSHRGGLENRRAPRSRIPSAGAGLCAGSRPHRDRIGGSHSHCKKVWRRGGVRSGLLQFWVAGAVAVGEHASSAQWRSRADRRQPAAGQRAWG